jgi:hypothetical protein
MAPRMLIATLVIAGSALALPGVSSAAQTPPPTQDSVIVTGGGSAPVPTLGVLTDIDVNVTSGPSGENPTGHLAARLGNQLLESSSITCFSVNGNAAVVGGTLQPNQAGFTNFSVVLVDNGPADSGLDFFGVAANSDCFPGLPGGNLFPGDIVVTDAIPLPTSTDQCKKGGYAQFGFKNLGGCVAFVILTRICDALERHGHHLKFCPPWPPSPLRPN